MCVRTQTDESSTDAALQHRNVNFKILVTLNFKKRNVISNLSVNTEQSCCFPNSLFTTTFWYTDLICLSVSLSV